MIYERRSLRPGQVSEASKPLVKDFDQHNHRARLRASVGGRVGGDE